MRRSAIVLLSGGLDSATVLAMVLADGFDVYVLSFQYGQRHAVELGCARGLAMQPGVIAHKVIDIDLRVFGHSALTDDIEVPKVPTEGVPITYVPARNTIFLSFALAWAEVIDAQSIFVGVNAVDYSGYPDCRPEYVEAFERAAKLGTRSGSISIEAPLVHKTKAEIIRLGSELGVNFAATSSCYDPMPTGACGGCDSCRIRRKGFEDAGISDLTRYAP